MAEDGHDQGTWIGGLLDAAARGYEPDGERLRELVSARIAEQERKRDGVRPGLPGRLRLARAGHGTRAGRGGGLRTRLGGMFSAGAGIAAVAGAVAIAVGVTTMLAVTSSSPTTSGPGRAGDGGGAGGAVSRTGAPAGPAPSTTPGAGGTSLTGQAPDSFTTTERVDAASNPNWAQLDVVVTAKRPLTGLEITVRVAGCPGLDVTGFFDTGAYGAFTSSRAPGAGGSIGFVFGLAAGHTLSPGTVEFAVQFNHSATGWRAEQDTYRISAQPAAAPAVTVTEGAY